jgi:hypothetical protein
MDGRSWGWYVMKWGDIKNLFLGKIINKCGLFNVDLHILFIYFKKVYDSIKLCAIWRALEELGCPLNLIRMIQLTLKGANAKHSWDLKRLRRNVNFLAVS